MLPYNKLTDIKKANVGTYAASIELFAKFLGLTDKNDNVMVPYKGEAQARLALISKEIDVISDTSMQSEDYKSRIKVLATSSQYGIYGLYSITALKSFPDSSVRDLNTKFNSVLKDAEVQQWLASRNLHNAGGTPEDCDQTYLKIK